MKKFIATMLCAALFGFLARGISMMAKGEIPIPFNRTTQQEAAPNRSWQEIGVIRWVNILQGGGARYSYSAPMTRGEAHRRTWSPDGGMAMFIPADDPEFIKALMGRKSS